VLNKNKINICPNPNCKTLYENPILISDRSKSPVEKFYGCPNCFLKVEPNITISTKKIENITEINKSGSINNCPKYFGYLTNNYTKLIIPIECLSCEKMTECLKDSN
jgi:hypothetical protein